MFPPSFLLITLFRRTKQKKNTVTQVNVRQPKRGKWKNLGTTSRSNMWGDAPKESKFKKFKGKKDMYRNLSYVPFEKCISDWVNFT